MSKTEKKTEGKSKSFFRRNEKQILLWLILILFIAVSKNFHWDKKMIAAAAILWVVMTQIFGVVFAYVLGWVGVLPWIGPLLVKILTWPIFLLINASAFMTSMVGLKMGHKRTVFEAKVSATILTIGVLIGYILGKVF